MGRGWDERCQRRRFNYKRGTHEDSIAAAEAPTFWGLELQGLFEAIGLGGLRSTVEVLGATRGS